MVIQRTLHPTPQPVPFLVKHKGEKQSLSYQEMFRAGYRLFLKKDFGAALRVFQLLASVSDRGPRARILQALCQAQLWDYAACSRTLSEAFDDGSGELDAKLHEVFVFWACGLLVDARQQLEAVIAEHPEYPTLSLLLADLLAQSGNRRSPPRFWRLAMQNDRPDGAVGLIARRELTDWLRSQRSDLN